MPWIAIRITRGVSLALAACFDECQAGFEEKQIEHSGTPCSSQITISSPSFGPVLIALLHHLHDVFHHTMSIEGLVWLWLPAYTVQNLSPHHQGIEQRNLIPNLLPLLMEGLSELLLG
jgi:hypothetical protein